MELLLMEFFQVAFSSDRLSTFRKVIELFTKKALDISLGLFLTDTCFLHSAVKFHY